MRISIDLSAYRRTHTAEYLVRFLLGGLVAVLAGLVAHRYGPVVGGLFLAFPAIFPASATLVAKHVQRKDGSASGSRAAGACAVGSSIGSLGLACFGAVIGCCALSLGPSRSLLLALATWCFVSAFGWWIRQRL